MAASGCDGGAPAVGLPASVREMEEAQPLIVGWRENAAARLRYDRVAESALGSRPDSEKIRSLRLALRQDAIRPDQPEFADYVTLAGEHEAALVEIDQLLCKGPIQAPEIFGVGQFFPELSEFQAFGRLRILRHVLAFQRKDFHAAEAELAAALRLGRALQKADGALSHYYAGASIESSALWFLRRLALDPACPAVVAERALATITAEGPPEADFVHALRREFSSRVMPSVDKIPSKTGNKDLAMQMVGKWVDAFGSRAQKVSQLTMQCVEGHPDAFDHDATSRLLVTYFRDAYDRATSPWSPRGDRQDMLDLEVDAWPIELVEQSGAALKFTDAQIAETRESLRMIDNPYGKLMARVMTPRLGDHVRSHRFLLATRETTRAIMALKVASLRDGSAPAALEDLPSAPFIDPFGRGSLRYDRERRIVWSVGPDGEDDGGYMLGGRRNGDLVWRAF